MSVLAALAAALLAVPAAHIIPVKMTPERIAEAIAFGTTKRGYVTYRKDSGGLTIHIDTPFARVASLAGQAARLYVAAPAPAEIPADVLDAVARVIVPPYVFNYSAGDSVVRSIEHLVIARPDGTIVRPITLGRLEPTMYGNAFGATAEASGLIATFPYDALAIGNEFRVVLLRGNEVAVKMDQKLLGPIR